MSILAGPYDSSDKKTDTGRNEELLVFGYACKMYRNDAKSILESSGQLLIPWMGDRSLMVDRYDVRNKLDDKNQFGLKPNLPRPISAEEMDLEDELDKERYLALEWDEIRVEEQEEMEKRKRASAYSAIGFSYDSKLPEEDLDGQPMEEPTASSLPSQVTPYDYDVYKRMEHPSTATVDHGTEDDQFTPHQDFLVPEGIQLPSTNKLHSIIEKTASFVCKQGNQMEIIIKTKQKFNPYFSFLNHEDDLYPYYRHLKAVIASGNYVASIIPVKNGVDKSEDQAVSPVNFNSNEVHTCKTKQEDKEDSKETDKPSKEQKPLPESDGEAIEKDSKNKRRRSKSKSVTETDTDGSDSEDEGYLHPLLLGGGVATKTKAPSPAAPSKSETSAADKKTSSDSMAKTSESEAKKMSLDEIMSLHDTSASFVARSLTINSAPLTARATEGEATRAYVTDPNMDPEALAAYEFYKEQYNNLNPASSAPVAVESQEGWYGYNQPPGDFAAVYDGGPQQIIPMNGHGHFEQHHQPQQQQQHYFDQHHATAVDHPHHPHSNYAPPPPPSEHQYPPPYYQCPPEAVPPPEIRAIVDKTAEYVAKNSEKFERTVLVRHLSDPRFSFLNPWDTYNYYYEAMKQYHRSMKEMTEDQDIPSHSPPPLQPSESHAAAQKHNVQKLSSSGAVQFKFERSKGLSSAGLVTPASSFDPESYYEEYEEGEEDELVDGELVDGDDGEGMGDLVEERLAEEQEVIPAPPAKRQRVEAENDEIGNTVQAFLSTVKGLFNQVTS